MADLRETPIQLQSDTLSNLPGGGVRTLTVNAIINGQPAAVQMQVVSIADANGVVMDLSNYDPWSDVLHELKDIRRLLAYWMGIPAFEDHRGTGEAGMGL